MTSVRPACPDGTSFVLTDAPLFVMKAKVLPGTTFVVGVDTAVRRAPAAHRPVPAELPRCFPGVRQVSPRLRRYLLPPQVRIVMPKYYGGSQEAMIEILETIRRCGCSFLVAGRVMEGEYRTIRAVQPPAGYEGALRGPWVCVCAPACRRGARCSSSVGGLTGATFATNRRVVPGAARVQG